MQDRLDHNVGLQVFVDADALLVEIAVAVGINVATRNKDD